MTVHPILLCKLLVAYKLKQHIDNFSFEQMPPKTKVAAA